MQPYALNTQQAEISRTRSSTPPASRRVSHPITPTQQRELPPVTDWDHFAAWCRQNGRQALPASDETLTLYIHARRREKRHQPVDLLGLLAMMAAILGVLAPALTLLTIQFTAGNLRLGLLTSGLLFIGLQVIALGSGWSSRQTTLGRAGWSIACLSTLVAMALSAVISKRGGLTALETLVAL